MGTKNNQSYTNGKAEKLSVPPGFASLSSFTLRSLRNKEAPCTPTVVGHLCDTEPSPIGSIPNILDVEKFKSSLWQRPWILDSDITHTPKEPGSELEMNVPAHLPKGVIRGCSSCPNCQKVTSRWLPEEPHKPVLEEVPVFHPTEEEFSDTIKYVASIRQRAEHIGMCRIVPPPSWKPPLHTGEKKMWDNLKFETSIQLVNELQDKLLKNQMVGALKEVKFKRRKVQVGNSEDGCPAEGCICKSGPKLTLKSFEKYADDFKRQYFNEKDKATSSNSNLRAYQEGWVPSVEDVEGEYWRIIENPSEEIEVLHGSKSESGVPSTGFPVNHSSTETPKCLDYLESGWNLNNTFKLRGSLLCYENNETQASLLPQLSAGMCFSSVCWNVGEHYLYSLSYMHLGGPKIWYVIPGRDCYKFQRAVKKHVPQCLEHPELLHRNVPQLSPCTLIAEAISVYRCVQHQGEFVLIFPAAYNSQFNCGFSCSEAVSFAPFDWLAPFGLHITEVYSEQGRRTSISLDKILLGAAAEAVRAQWQLIVLRGKLSDEIPWPTVCGKDGILTKAFRLRVKHEDVRRHYLCKSLQSQKMQDNFDLHTKRECCICLYDLHFSAVGCPCSPGRYACLRHAMDLCSCSWTARFLLIRYEIHELNVLADALEGKLYAVVKWGRKIGCKMHSSRGEAPPKASALPPLSPALQACLSDGRKEHGVQQVSRTEQKADDVLNKAANCDGCGRQDTDKYVVSKPLNSNKREGKNAFSNQSEVVVIIDDGE